MEKTPRHTVWRIIEGFRLYEVSNYGKVKSRGYPDIILKTDKCGAVMLKHNLGEWHRVKVDMLVAEYFVPNPEEYCFVHHKNDNPKDSRWYNLEWVKVKPKQVRQYKGRINIKRYAKQDSKDNAEESVQE